MMEEYRITLWPGEPTFKRKTDRSDLGQKAKYPLRADMVRFPARYRMAAQTAVLIAG